MSPSPTGTQHYWTAPVAASSQYSRRPDGDQDIVSGCRSIDFAGETGVRTLNCKGAGDSCSSGVVFPAVCGESMSAAISSYNANAFLRNGFAILPYIERDSHDMSRDPSAIRVWFGCF
jgi:uncharacterized membrane protein